MFFLPKMLPGGYDEDFLVADRHLECRGTTFTLSVRCWNSGKQNLGEAETVSQAQAVEFVRRLSESQASS